MIARERGHAGEALDAFRRALARDPLLMDALVGGAATARSAGDEEDATRWLARARRLSPGDIRLPELERRAAGGRT